MKKDKIPFDSYEDAEKELHRILDTKYNVCKKTKPSRIYLDKDGKWYLTSKPKVIIY